MTQQPLSYNNPYAPVPAGSLHTDRLPVTNATVVRPTVGGRRKSKKNRKNKNSRRGGFYPGVMSPMATSGVYLIGPALSNAYRLLNRKSRRSSNRRSRRSV